MKLDCHELYNISGGAISASWISAIVRAFNSLVDFGIKVGSSLRRGLKKNYC